MQRHAHPSVSARAAKIVDQIAANADALRLTVSIGSQGERLIDMGGAALGCLEAGRLLEVGSPAELLSGSGPTARFFGFGKSVAI